jgi:hypothetical protein
MLISAWLLLEEYWSSSSRYAARGAGDTGIVEKDLLGDINRESLFI